MILNIKVRTSLALAACSLAGLALGSLLVQRYTAVERGIADSGRTSVTVRNTEVLRESVGHWLHVNDSILLKGQDALVATSIELSRRLRRLITDIERSDLGKPEIDRLEHIRRTVEAIDAELEQTDQITGSHRPRALQQAAALLEHRFDQLVLDVRGVYQRIRAAADNSHRRLESERKALTMSAWLAGLLYFGVVWICWIWMIQRIVRPIETLSAAAARADTEGRAFALPETGPAEVRQLTTNISNFVRKLKDAKAGTEEEIRQRTAELVEASKAKGQFLATMSHELRTPLNGIINMNELILDTGLNPEQTGFAQTAKNAAEALLALINDILDFSKIEARKLELEAVDFDLREIVDSSVEILAGVAESKALELTAVTAWDVPDRVIGDPMRLRQVLINLLNNALKFTSDGEVTVSARLLDHQKEQVTLRLEVRDTGIGIPEDRRESLFRAFEQVDSSTTRRFGGTGLGLAICRELVDLMGGSIHVESEVGVGSTFWFTIALQTAEQPPRSTLNIDGAIVISRRHGVRERLTELLRLLDVPADKIILLQDAKEVAAAQHGRWLAIHDPYERADGFAFQGIDELSTSLSIPIAVLDHWMRHWPESMGVIPNGIRKLAEPTNARGLTAFVDETGGKARLPTSTPTHAPSLSPMKPGARVLVVEDTPVNQRVARAILERHGFTTVLAENGAQAVHAFERDTFDLVLMDCQMPVMDGLEATRHIRAYEASRGGGTRIPIIALTAHPAADYRDECLAAGMDRFLSKPCRSGPLLEAIKEIVAERNDSVPQARVLVADDDAINRRVASTILERAGYNVTTVNDGQAAFDATQSAEFDIILMDWHMPVLDGLEATRLIREREESLGKDHMPILALTGNAQESDRQEAVAAGMDAVLTKPFRPPDLIAMVHSLLEQTRASTGTFASGSGPTAPVAD